MFKVCPEDHPCSSWVFVKDLDIFHCLTVTVGYTSGVEELQIDTVLKNKGMESNLEYIVAKSLITQ